ncbi:hypothetical protein GDO86_009787 [Hymenochirus boettgeri]|uniref:Protein MMS22-like n=1 Tax=Hymenochirus boettgeri TaxID=247094 RepID=A0A8T2JQS0_9PIPI|nr:hypothetical protein GDO86_009787 [Hymenochirus boettgeri]
MSQDFTVSLTPPISPYFLDLTGDEVCRPPCFSCNTAHRLGYLATAASYLSSGSLKRLLLRLDPSPTDYESDTVEIFGFQWVTETALVESTNLLFGMLRQKLNTLENLAQPSSELGQLINIHSEAEEIRSQCVQFLHYVKVFIYRFLDAPKIIDDSPVHPYEEMEAHLPSKILEELHGLSLYVGRLCELPACVRGALQLQHQGKVLPASWHLLHLHFDIQWSIIEILHILGDKMQGQIVFAHEFINLVGENLTNVSLFEEQCEHLMCDLIHFASNRYIQVRPSEALNNQIYPCICVKEMWILLVQLLDHKSKGSSSESFWIRINRLLKSLLQGSSGTEKHTGICNVVQCKDPLGLSWWLLTHLSQLYTFDRNGNPDEVIQIKSNWKFAEELLKKSSDVQNSVLEDELRMHLQCCLALCDIWEPNLTAGTILWELYSKNLNSSFNIRWLGLQTLACVSKSSLSMLEVVKNCCSDKNIIDIYKSENSYLIFLRILAILMKKSKEISGTHPWKQMKGRIYSKFHQKKGKSLQNLSVSQKALLWRGNFAFMLIYVEKNMDISAPAEKLSHSFRETAKEFLVLKSDYGQKHTLWTILSTYVDGVQEVFETSHSLKLSEEKLLNDGFSMMLPACRESELSCVLTFLQTAVAKLRNIHSSSVQAYGKMGPNAQSLLVVKEHHLAVASGLWRNFFPFLKNLRLSQTPPSQLADTVAGYTLLTLVMPNSAPSELQPQPLVSIFQLFGWDDMITPQLVSRYLNHLLTNSEILSAFAGIGNSAYQALSIRTWIRCVLQIYIDKPSGTILRTDQKDIHMEQLAELTRIVFKLPEVENLLSKGKIEPPSYKQDPRSAVLQFIKAAGVMYGDLHTLAEKSAMVTKCLDYLGDILKYIKPYLTKKGPSEGLQITYRTMGCLVRYWALMLATSKAQQLLFRIIDFLLLPHALFQQDKDLPPALLSAIRESLPQFLQGLSVISRQSQSQGAYVKQQLKMIIQQYFGRFLPSAPTVAVAGSHPLLLALCENVQNPQTVYLRRIIMQVISENYLQFKGHSPPPRLAFVLSFISDVLQRSKGADIQDAETLLPSVLKCLILVNEPQVKRFSTEVLQYIVESCQTSLTEANVNPLSTVLRQFIQDYGLLYDHQIYSILETLSILDQPLVTSLIPTISQSLLESEHKRGLGRNSASRNAYRRLLSHLGEHGQAAMQTLDN